MTFMFFISKIRNHYNSLFGAHASHDNLKIVHKYFPSAYNRCVPNDLSLSTIMKEALSSNDVLITSYPLDLNNQLLLANCLLSKKFTTSCIYIVTYN
jgi:hypothetical protein